MKKTSPPTKPQDDSRLKKFRDLLVAFKKDSDTWNQQRRKVEKIFMGQSVQGVKKQTYNMLWSNVSVLQATCFSRIPKPVSERRFKDKDPIGLLAAKLEERAVSFSLDAEENGFYYAVNDAVRDRFLGGIGICWARYEPYFEEVIDEATQAPKVDAKGNPIERVTFEEALTDYILPCDFGWNSNARNPREIRQVWKKVRLSKRKLAEQFGSDIASQVSLDDDSEEEKYQVRSQAKEIEPKALVYELWDIETKCVYHFTESGLDTFLKEPTPDPLGLKHFFPVPRPLLGTLCGQNLFPTPDYCIYERLAEQLNDVNERLGSLTQMVRLVGIHDASINDTLERLRTAADGVTIPISGYSNVQGSGGLAGSMEWLPIVETANAIAALEQRAGALTQRIYEITGMSDIVRGSTNPYETKGAQEIKNQWASIRVVDKQHDVQRFIKDLLELKAQIICKQFSEESWKLMTGFDSLTLEEQQIFPQALALLKNDDMRTFRISLETDSTIEINEDKDKAARMEFVNSLANLFAQGAQIIQVDPTLKTTALQSILMAARGFRQGREVEQYLTTAIDEMIMAQEQAKKNPPPPQPSPEELKIQSEERIAQMKLQMEQQLEGQKLQADQMKAQADFQMKEQKLQGDMAIKEAKLQAQAELQEEKARLQQEVAAQKAMLESVKANRDAELEIRRIEAQLQVAQIQANATLQAAQIQAARAAVEDEKVKAEKEESKKEKAQPIVVNVDAKRPSKRKVTIGNKTGIIEDIED